MRNWMLELRASLGVTQAEMAERIGVTPGRVSHIENGRGNLSAQKLFAIWQGPEGRRLRKLGFKLEDLFGLD